MKKTAPKKPHLARRPVKKAKKVVKKKMTRKVIKKVTRTVQAKRPQALARKPKLQPVGIVTHYYDRIGVGVLKLSNVLRVGDRLRLRGKKEDFDQVVRSIQIEHTSVDTAPKGADIGIKVDQEARRDAVAYKLP